MKEKFLTFLKIIGGFLWVMGGGMLISSIVIGIPVAILLLLGWISLGLILKYVPQIIVVAVVVLLLVYGFSKKVPNPYQ